MNGHGVKIGNEYMRLLGYYDRIPKAVLAAIAVSFAARLSSKGELTEAAGEIAREWLTLHENGILVQRPPADVLAKIPKE